MTIHQWFSLVMIFDAVDNEECYGIPDWLWDFGVKRGFVDV